MYDIVQDVLWKLCTCVNCKRMCHYPYSGSNAACTGGTTYFWFLLASHFSRRPNHLCITSYSIGCPNCVQCHPPVDILKQRCHMNNYQPITIHWLYIAHLELYFVVPRVQSTGGEASPPNTQASPQEKFLIAIQNNGIEQTIARQ